MQRVALRPAILVVDSDEAIRDALQLILDDDYDVVSVPGGEAALRALEHRHFGLVLLDLLMPKVDGWEVFELLLRMNTRRPRVIFLTGVDSSTAAVAAVKLGAEDWIVKPFDETLLLTQLRGLFHNRRIFIHGGDSGTRGTIAVLASLSCGLSVEYLEDGLAPSDDGGSPVIDAVIAGSEKGLAALLSRPPLMTALGESTIAALHHVSRRYWEVNVDGLAQAVGLSADSLLKLFKRDLSVTPREYIARVRVEVIKQRLARPGRPSLERLAEEVGLCDAAHLSRIFMRYEGQSPGLYGGNIQGDGGSIH